MWTGMSACSCAALVILSRCTSDDPTAAGQAQEHGPAWAKRAQLCKQTHCGQWVARLLCSTERGTRGNGPACAVTESSRGVPTSHILHSVCLNARPELLQKGPQPLHHNNALAAR